MAPVCNGNGIENCNNAEATINLPAIVGESSFHDASELTSQVGSIAAVAVIGFLWFLISWRLEHRRALRAAQQMQKDTEKAERGEEVSDKAAFARMPARPGRAARPSWR
jgi:hypothetical protein